MRQVYTTRLDGSTLHTWWRANLPNVIHHDVEVAPLENTMLGERHTRPGCLHLVMGWWGTWEDATSPSTKPHHSLISSLLHKTATSTPLPKKRGALAALPEPRVSNNLLLLEPVVSSKELQPYMQSPQRALPAFASTSPIIVVAQVTTTTQAKERESLSPLSALWFGC